MNDELIKREELIKRIDACNNGVVFPDNLLADCRAALSRKYTPMTDDERTKWWASEWTNRVLLEKFEAEVIRRAGLEVSE